LSLIFGPFDPGLKEVFRLSFGLGDVEFMVEEIIGSDTYLAGYDSDLVISSLT
jgi:hypothetical protein